jgi:hypothetical protein
MSRFIGDQLPDALVGRLQPDRAVALADRAIVICTVDEHGWPHPAMLGSLEVAARDTRNIRFALHAGSRSARNLQANGIASLVLADADGVYYLKGDVLLLAASLRTLPGHAKFNLRVDSVLEDRAPGAEAARVVSGIRVERPLDAGAARAVLAELLEE